MDTTFNFDFLSIDDKSSKIIESFIYFLNKIYSISFSLNFSYNIGLDNIKVYLLYTALFFTCIIFFMLFYASGYIYFRPGNDEPQSDEENKSDGKKSKKKNKGKEKASDYSTGGGDNSGKNPGGGDNSGKGPSILECLSILGKRKLDSDKENNSSRKKSSRYDGQNYEAGESSNSQNRKSQSYSQSSAQEGANPQSSSQPFSQSANNYGAFTHPEPTINTQLNSNPQRIDPSWQDVKYGEERDLGNYGFRFNDKFATFITEEGTISVRKLKKHDNDWSMPDSMKNQVESIGESTYVNYRNMQDFRAFGFGDSLLKDCKINNKWNIPEIQRRIEKDYQMKVNLIHKINARSYYPNPYQSQYPLSQSDLSKAFNSLKQGRNASQEFIKILEEDNKKN